MRVHEAMQADTRRLEVWRGCHMAGEVAVGWGRRERAGRMPEVED